MNRYLIGFLACLGLAILLVILLFSSSSKPVVPTKPPTILPDLASTSTQVRMVVDGPIIANQNHNTGIVTIDKNSATFDLIQGYNGNVVTSKTYNNTENSYKNFLYALYYAGYTSKIKTNYPSDIGLCSTGDRYDFYVIQNGKDLMHTYSTSCSAAPRSFGGNFGTTNYLFSKQIPDLDTLTAGANF